MIDAIKFRELVEALALASAEVMATKGAASVRWARACNERQRAIDELANLLVDHADALLALVEADGWQPIETAPKDGEYFLGFIDNKGEDFNEILVMFCKRGHEPFWTTPSDDKIGYKPTHWRALPSPPETKP